MLFKKIVGGLLATVSMSITSIDASLPMGQADTSSSSDSSSSSTPASCSTPPVTDSSSSPLTEPSTSTAEHQALGTVKEMRFFWGVQFPNLVETRSAHEVNVISSSIFSASITKIWPEFGGDIGKLALDPKQIPDEYKVPLFVFSWNLCNACADSRFHQFVAPFKLIIDGLAATDYDKGRFLVMSQCEPGGSYVPSTTADSALVHRGIQLLCSYVYYASGTDDDTMSSAKDLLQTLAESKDELGKRLFSSFYFGVPETAELLHPDFQ